MLLDLPYDCIYVIIINCNACCVSSLQSICKKSHSLIHTKKSKIFGYISIRDIGNHLRYYERKKYLQKQHELLNDISMVMGKSLKVAHFGLLLEHMQDTKFMIRFLGSSYIRTIIDKIDDIEEEETNDLDVVWVLQKFSRLRTCLLCYEQFLLKM